MVRYPGDPDAFLVGICNRSNDLVRSPVGRLRDHHPAAHRGTDEAYVRRVLQMDLVAMGRGGTQDPATGPAVELSRHLRPPLRHAPAGRLGRVDNLRLRTDLPRVGAAIPVCGWIGWLRHTALLASRPPSAIKLLHRYSGTDRSEILRGNLREAERWMAEMLQSHLSHPMLSFYRAQHWGQSWLVSLTTVLDVCALLITGGEGLLEAQARITYRMGLRLLKDLTDALSLKVDPRCRMRLSRADLPALLAAVKKSGIPLSLGPGAAIQLLRLVRRYDVYLAALSELLVIPLPSWIQPREARRENDGSERSRARTDLPIHPTISQGGLAHPADGPVDNPSEKQGHDIRSDTL
jgi:hypothetical protein